MFDPGSKFSALLPSLALNAWFLTCILPLVLLDFACLLSPVTTTFPPKKSKIILQI